MTAVLRKPSQWRRGEPLAASKLNESVDALGLIIQYLGSAPLPKGASVAVIATFEVVSVAGDYVTAKRVMGSQTANVATNVAKPRSIRNSVTARGSATYSYTGTDERTATVGGDTEDQVVVPAFTVGDQFLAVRVPSGGTGVTDAPNWLDLNDWARAWARSA